LASRSTWVPVVALALKNAEGRLLLQQRPPGKAHAGLWEFPGGKVESEEFPRLALCREIAEELAITILPQDLAPALLADEGPMPGIVLFLYTCTRWRGLIVGLEGQAWGWFAPSALADLPMPPMDRSFAERLAGGGGQ
jgi:8-oxo-dGTP diphosphatase